MSTLLVGTISVFWFLIGGFINLKSLLQLPGSSRTARTMTAGWKVKKIPAPPKLFSENWLMKLREQITGAMAACLTISCSNPGKMTTPPPHPVPEIGKYDGSDWSSTLKAFAHSKKWRFKQSWRDDPELDLASGTARLGWRDDRLIYLVEFKDKSVTTRATTRNQFLYLLGDVCELFAGESGNPQYIEYHTAPNGKILQLRFPHAQAVREAGGLEGLKQFTVEDDKSVQRVGRTRDGWAVYGEVPLKSVGATGHSLKGRVWEISFGRYDYTPGNENPVISSTSPHRKASFHRRHEWRKVIFE